MAVDHVVTKDGRKIFYVNVPGMGKKAVEEYMATVKDWFEAGHSHAAEKMADAGIGRKECSSPLERERESVRVLLEAAEVQRRKSLDYQNPNSTVTQADYYPNGVKTIQDIIWAKNLRARSLLESGAAPKNESLEDTYLDMINYCSFAVAYLRGKVPGQDPARDAFNKPRTDTE